VQGVRLASYLPIPPIAATERGPDPSNSPDGATVYVHDPERRTIATRTRAMSSQVDTQVRLSVTSDYRCRKSLHRTVALAQNRLLDAIAFNASLRVAGAS
jgi:hypothetical protein